MTTNPATPPISSEEQEKIEKQKSHEANIRAFAAASSELLFVLLPFIVIGITLAHRGEFRTILRIPEWSIVSAVIVGQGIVKLASAAMGKIGVKKENVVLIISALLVCLLVPILIVLAIVLTSEVSKSMAIIQAVLFLLGISVFWLTSVIENWAAS